MVTTLNPSRKPPQFKKRAKREQIKEIVFDDDARREFLTGFHKRKLAKADERKRKALERQKKERLESRREQRRLLAVRAAENAAQVEKACGATSAESLMSEIDEYAREQKNKQQHEEYEDETQLATVTVVEDFEPDSITDTVPQSTQLQLPPSEADRQKIPRPATRAKRSTDNSKATGKTRKVHYETKSARKEETRKQRARRKDKAERAGGKRAKGSRRK